MVGHPGRTSNGFTVEILNLWNPLDSWSVRIVTLVLGLHHPEIHPVHCLRSLAAAHRLHGNSPPPLHWRSLPDAHIGVLLWPLGWAVAALITQGILDFMTDPC